MSLIITRSGECVSVTFGVFVSEVGHVLDCFFNNEDEHSKVFCRKNSFCQHWNLKHENVPEEVKHINWRPKCYQEANTCL